MDIEYNKLNDDWIEKFDKTDKLYQDFYKDDLYYIKLKIVYINRNNEIEKIKQESFLMSKPNFISREEIIQILKKNILEDNRNYSLLSILRYNITLDSDDVKDYIYSSKQERNFLSIVKNIDAISFDKTINMFQDLNDLIFLFYEKSTELKTYNPDKSTKKIYLREKIFKKTIKKRYKD
jgi:hypothetical protein